MNKQWLIILAIIAVIVLMNNPMGKLGKKEAAISFRCSEDEKSIEIYDIVSEKSSVWQSCGEGTCEETNGRLLCNIPETKKEETTKFNPSLMLLAAAIVLLIVYKRTRRKTQ